MSGVLLPLLSKENQVGGKATVLWTSNSTILPSLTVSVQTISRLTLC